MEYLVLSYPKVLVFRDSNLTGQFIYFLKILSLIEGNHFTMLLHCNIVTMLFCCITARITCMYTYSPLSGASLPCPRHPTSEVFTEH